MRIGVSALVLLTLCLAVCKESDALPVFAHRFGFSCQTCHSVVPQLNAFGQEFLRAGYRLPQALQARSAFPVAIKVNLSYAGSGNGSGLPKAIVDEVELLAGASISPHTTYRLEQYLVDGGMPGKTRDAWLQFNSRPSFGDRGTALRLTGGEFTLPLPLDPETERYTLNHYAIFDQTVGGNPFNFFNDRLGLDAAYGKTPGVDVHVLGMMGHDPQSGLQSMGLDRMLFAQGGSASTVLSFYRYDGARPLQPVIDRFWRQGVAINTYLSRAEINVLLQQGLDSSADGLGLSSRSGGGFAQFRWIYSSALFAVVRYDNTYNASGNESHSFTTSLVYRPVSNARFTIEDVTEGGRHNLNTALLFAY